MERGPVLLLYDRCLSNLREGICAYDRQGAEHAAGSSPASGLALREEATCATQGLPSVVQPSAECASAKDVFSHKRDTTHAAAQPAGQEGCLQFVGNVLPSRKVKSTLEPVARANSFPINCHCPWGISVLPSRCAIKSIWPVTRLAKCALVFKMWQVKAETWTRTNAIKPLATAVLKAFYKSHISDSLFSDHFVSVVEIRIGPCQQRHYVAMPYRYICDSW